MSGYDRIDADKLAGLCGRFHVRFLALFGSALRDDFNPATSDFDFVVDFEPLSPEKHADAYFGLIEALEELTSAEVDLVELRAIRNPYFRRAVDERQKVLYAAA